LNENLVLLNSSVTRALTLGTADQCVVAGSSKKTDGRLYLKRQEAERGREENEEANDETS
jgi:hypothetical protein